MLCDYCEQDKPQEQMGKDRHLVPCCKECHAFLDSKPVRALTFAGLKELSKGKAKRQNAQ